jgi:phage head maturation protease
MDGMSFAFRVLTDDWRTEDGEPLREVRDLELFDVSVVSYPAYAETQVDVRAVQVGQETLRTAQEVAAGIPLEIRRKRLEQTIREAR